MLKNIFIASGGTGGHIIPARCLANKLTKDGYKIVFLGDKKYASYIQNSDQFDSIIINSSQIKKSPISLFFAGIKIFLGFLQSLYFFIKIRPKYIFAFGGYATFPILIAAVITKTKIILHEQNSHLGKVNKIFAKYAYKIALSFAKTDGIEEKYITKTVFVGNPIREEIAALNKREYILPKNGEVKIRSDNKMGYDVLLTSDFYETRKPRSLFNILIIGGSGGAKIFSEILPKAFFNLSEEIKSNIQIFQQCRKDLVKSTFDQYSSFNINIVVDSFFNDMPELLNAAHLVIARSGASSIFEFCAAKKPMILVPFANAADNHQEKNALYLEKNGAAIMIKESEFEINRTTEILRELLNKPEILCKMSDNASKLAMLDATNNLSKLING